MRIHARIIAGITKLNGRRRKERGSEHTGHGTVGLESGRSISALRGIVGHGRETSRKPIARGHVFAALGNILYSERVVVVFPIQLTGVHMPA